MYYLEEIHVLLIGRKNSFDTCIKRIEHRFTVLEKHFTKNLNFKNNTFVLNLKKNKNNLKYVYVILLLKKLNEICLTNIKP